MKTQKDVCRIKLGPRLLASAASGSHPHLASALLNHHDPRVTEEHYNHATTFSAGEEYTLITESCHGF
jgi:hypothetical protein